MAGEKQSTVALRFRLAALERAESLAKSVLTTVVKAKDLAKDVREQLTQQIKERIDNVRLLKDNVRSTIRLQQRADAIKDRVRSGLNAGELAPLVGFEKTFEGFAGKTLGAFKRNVGDVTKPLRDLANGDVSGAVEEVVGNVGGPVGKIASFLTKTLREYVDQRIAAETKLRVDTLRTELQEQRYRDDYQRRLREEPSFARAEAARAWEQTVREERRLSEQGFSQQSDLLERF